MKTNFVLVTLSLIGLYFFSSATWAYDDLLNNEYGGVIPSGRLVGCVRINYMTSSNMFDSDGKKKDLADNSTDLQVLPKVKYGVTDKLSAFAILPFQKWDMGDAGESGLRDMWLGVNYSILPENALNTRVTLDIPIGDGEKGFGNAGGLGIDAAAVSNRRTGNIWYWGSVGFRYNGEDGDTKWKPGFGFFTVHGVDYQFIEAFRGCIQLQYMNIGDGQSDGKSVGDSAVNWLELAVGCRYIISEKLRIRSHISYDVTGKNTNADLGFYFDLQYIISKGL